MKNPKQIKNWEHSRFCGKHSSIIIFFWRSKKPVAMLEYFLPSFPRMGHRRQQVGINLSLGWWRVIFVSSAFFYSVICTAYFALWKENSLRNISVYHHIVVLPLWTNTAPIFQKNPVFWNNFKILDDTEVVLEAMPVPLILHSLYKNTVLNTGLRHIKSWYCSCFWPSFL